MRDYGLISAMAIAASLLGRPRRVCYLKW